MSGSSTGTLFRVSTWGESHGRAIGAVIDGCPAGLTLAEEDIQPYLDRRRPGQNRFATQRKESDRVSILSGVFEGKTTGTPISLLIRNEDQHSQDYSALAEVYRPGHADFGYDAKFGFRDYRGGGRSSGRETAARVAAGAVAAKLLQEIGIKLLTYTEAIGPVRISAFDPDQITGNPLCMPDADAAERAALYLDTCIKEQDSCGGIIVCRASGIPAGVGEPVFDKLDAALAKAVFSIGAVKGVEIGDGFQAAGSRGSENNDAFLPPASADAFPSGENCPCTPAASGIRKASNHAGGILGGISDGSEILVRAAVKPTPSIAREQHTVKRDGSAAVLSIGGRHDPVIVPRAVVVVESMVALTLADFLLIGMSSRLDNVKSVWGNLHS